MKALISAADLLDRLVERIGRITGWCAFALVLVMAFNVLLRYLFRTGSVAMQELEWHLMAPICMLGLSYAILHDGHVRVDILYGRFPPAARRVVDLVSAVLVVAVVGILLKLSIPYVEQSYAIGEVSPDPGGLTHRWILKSMLPIGFGLLLVQSLAAALRALVAVVSGRDVGGGTTSAGSADGPVAGPVAGPAALTLAVSGLVFGYLGFGPILFNLLPARIFGVTANYTLIAIPLFVFMGVMLEKSKLADELMDVIGHLAGGRNGGMAIGIILVGVMMGATTGIVGATIVTLGVITLPALMRRGYHLPTACGTICASGTLGQIIPPSTILILLADILGQSVGTLFAAALLPGLLLAGVMTAYLLLLGLVRPEMVPPVSLAERAAMTRGDLARKAMRVGLPPVGLVLAVLGSIIGGVAAPTEAASMGALGSIVVVMLAGRFSLGLLRETTLATTRITAGMMFVLICAQVFALAFRGLNGEQLVHDLFKLVPGGVNSVLIFMSLIIFVLGFFIEWIEISYIVVPLFLPILQAAGVDLVWVAALIALNLQTSFLTPPFGWALFYLRSVAPPSVPTLAIYKGVVPFILLQVVTLTLVFLYPGVATWLPRAIGW